MTSVISDFFQLSASLFSSILGLPFSAGVTLAAFVVSAFVILTVTGLFFRFKR